MRYSRETEFPDCTSAEQAKDAVLRLISVVVLPCISPGVYIVRVDADGYCNNYGSWVEAIDRAKEIKGIEREPGTNKLCYRRPLLIVTVLGEPWSMVKMFARRPKLRKLKQ